MQQIVWHPLAEHHAARSDDPVVVFAPGPDRDPIRLVGLLRDALVGLKHGQLWCVTRGAREPRDTNGLAQSALWGIARVAAVEHPGKWGGLVDLPAEPSLVDFDALGRLVDGRYDEGIISITGGRLSTARLTPVHRRGSGPRCEPGGTYLITGGTGALGWRVAYWLAGRGATRLVLLSRRTAPPRGHNDPREALEAAGVTVRIVSADISDRDAVAWALDGLELPPIRGVVHAAGVVDGQFIHTFDDDSLREVLRPKVFGALVLDELFPAGSLDFFVLFSSARQLLRRPGQVAHAAGNAFLEGMARRRPDVLSLAWTSWAELSAIGAGRGHGSRPRPAPGAQIHPNRVSALLNASGSTFAPPVNGSCI